MPRRSPFEITLSPEEQRTLEAQARQYSAPHAKVVRAKVILLAAQGLENEQIAKRLDLSRQMVSKWRKRFHQERLQGLGDAPRSGRPPSFPPSGGSQGQGSCL